MNLNRIRARVARVRWAAVLPLALMAGLSLLHPGTSSANVDVPITFSGAAQAPAWLGSAQVVTVSAKDPAGASDVDYILCDEVVNGTSTVSHYTVASQQIPLQSGVTNMTCNAVTATYGTGNDYTGSWHVDPYKPTVAFGGAATTPAWNLRQQTVSVTAAETAAPAGQQVSGVASIDCSVDGGQSQENVGAATQVTVSGSGSHTVTCHGVNGAGVAGDIATEAVQIDNQAPVLSFTGSSPAPAWLGTVQKVTVSAAEATPMSGVSNVTCDVNDGGSSSTVTTQGDTETVTLGDGAHTLDCNASSGTGVTSADADYSVLVDTQQPTVTFSGASASPGWAGVSQEVTATAAEPRALSGIASTVCRTDGGSWSATAGAAVSIPSQGPGTHTVDCYAITGAGVAGPTASEQIQVDGQQPTISFAGGQAAPAWVSGAQSVIATGSEPTAMSGIAEIVCRVDGGAWSSASGATGDLPPVSAAGVHQIDCYAVNGSGVAGPVASESVQIDSTAPTVSFSGGPSQTTWATTSQQVTVTGNAPGGSGITGLVCTIGGTSTSYPNAGGGASESQTITVPAPGGVLACQAENGAGVASPVGGWHFQIDSTPPTGYFEPLDPSNPTQLRLVATDAGSGVANAVIEIESGSEWKPLATSYDAQAGVATATVLDDGSLPSGTYAVRGEITDAAGNTATVSGTGGAAASAGADAAAGSGLAISGDTASLTLPLRGVTELDVAVAAGNQEVEAWGSASVASGSGSKSLDALAAMAGPVKRVCKVKPKRTCVKQAPKLVKRLTLAYGQKAKVAGELTTQQGAPVKAEAVTIEQMVTGEKKAVTIATVTTNANGVFRYTVPAGPGRVLTFSYAGSPVLRGSSESTQMRVDGKVKLTVPRRVTAGRKLTVRGQIEGGHMPAAGALVQLWYRVVGARAGWAPFEHVVHARKDGRFGITFPTSSGAKGYQYRFKASVSRQAGWPYLSATSNVETRTVA